MATGFASTIQPARTQTIRELEGLLVQLRDIEAEESQLLAVAQDRQQQAAVFNELARIEEQQNNILEQLTFVKKQRVVEKARQINQEQKKLLQLMVEAEEAEASSPRNGAGSPAAGSRRESQYSLRSSGGVSEHSGYFARSASAGGGTGSPVYSNRSGSSNGYSQQEASRLAPVRTRLSAPSAELSKTQKRTRAAETDSEPVEDDEPDFGKEVKRQKGGASIIVSGGLPGFKIAQDLYTARK